MINLQAIATQGNKKKITGQSKDGKALKLETGEVVTVNAITEAIKAKLVTVSSETEFELADGTSMYQRRDGAYGFTNKAQGNKFEF